MTDPMIAQTRAERQPKVTTTPEVTTAHEDHAVARPTVLSIPSILRLGRRHESILRTRPTRTPTAVVKRSSTQRKRARTSKVIRARPTTPVVDVPAHPPLPLYVEYCEKNGWEAETWRTYIPYDCNAKLLHPLRALLKRINFFNGSRDGHREKHDKRKKDERARSAAYMDEYRSTGDALSLMLAQHVMNDLQLPMICAMCTTFTLDLEILYTEAEARVRMDTYDGNVNYMAHTFLEQHTKIDRALLREYCGKVRSNDPEKIDDVFGAFYKGGISNLFVDAR